MRASVHRGMTMIELLLALGLLSAIAVVMLSWTSVAADSTGAFADRVAWERSARAVLRMIAEDVASGDFEQPQRRTAAREPRVRIAQDQLTIRTRTAEGEAVDRRYRLEQQSLRLSEGVLLENVKSFTCEVDVDEQWLHVMIVSSFADISLSRRYRLP